jgi:hypothetical protein
LTIDADANAPVIPSALSLEAQLKLDVIKRTPIAASHRLIAVDVEVHLLDLHNKWLMGSKFRSA